MNILVIAEHGNTELNPATLNTVAAAIAIGGDVDLLVAGHQCQDAAEQATQVKGIRKVLVADSEVYTHQLAENMAPLITGIASGYSHILAAAGSMGKNLMPRVAALLDTASISDVSRFNSPDKFERPIYAGNIVATVESTDSIKVITIRTTAFPAADATGGSAILEAIPSTPDQGLSRFVGEELTQSDRPELTAADIVISGGRGLGNAENFAIIEKIADQLGAAVGASRAAVDGGYISNDYQVGQTGKIVAPSLYIAVGISGAIQHLAGMKDSKVIVAINKDEDAPIFQVADYGIVGDLFKILPELSAELEKLS